jgi:peptide/nickel transport system permease protein
MFILRRVLVLVPAMLIVSLGSFSLIHLAPGDPAEILLTSPGGGVNQASVEEFRVKMGLDQPFLVQYAMWLGKALQGDLGYSYMTGQPVFEAVLDGFWPTLKLSLVSMAFSLAVSIPLGIWSAIRPGSFADRIGRWGSLIGVSMPNFWQAYLLILAFSLGLRWFPVAGYGEGGDFSHIILPAAVLGTVSAAVTSRLMRTSMIEVLEQDYITSAKAKGLSERDIILKHALKNALIPIATMTGLSFGYMLNGSVVVETVFAWPGIGNLVVESIYQRDYPMIQGTVLFVALLFMAVNLVVDVSYTLINPRIRYDLGK